MGELTFLLGLQVKQKQVGIFISQDKYVAKILRKFGLTYGKSASTPIDTEKPLLKDPDGEDMDVHTYRSMISSLMYLTSSRPDIMFAYALMVNPTIYVSCIKQFWTSISIKKANDVVRLQDLIDRKKVIITEDSIRQALRLDDADSVDCLPNKEIFVELARMGYENPSTKLTFYKAFFSAQWKFLIHTILQCISAKRTAWNEFSSSMALTVMCLATGVDTPLFDGILVSQQSQDVEDVADNEDDVKEVSVEPTPHSPTPVTLPPPPQQEHIPSPPQDETIQPSSPSQPQPSQTQALKITKLKQRVRRLEKKRGEIVELDANEDITLETVDAEVAMNVLFRGGWDTDEAEPAEVKEVIEVVTTAKLMIEVVTTAATTITVAQEPKASAPRRRKGVVIHYLEETSTLSVIVHSEDEAFARQLEAELNSNINWNDVVDHVKRKEKQDNTVMRYQALKRKPITEAHERKNMMVYLKNMAGFKMDFFKGEEHITEQEEGSKRKDASPEQRVAKKQRIYKEVEELKTHLQIVPNDEDDVYTEAIPLALKVPVVDYQIHH
uniref:Uncharacterized protein n=1 Tax=Tanacetum cinerariifolium TaxID=118510 RepID=A0A6L2JYK4_TANCI|nr:hypothetical protein [Tanacetum cinerariifolium]